MEARNQGPNALQRKNRFIQMNAWLVQERYLIQLLFKPEWWQGKHVIPGLDLPPTLRSIRKMIWSLCCARRIKAHSVAQVITVRSNLRAFYLEGRPYTAKILLNG